MKNTAPSKITSATFVTGVTNSDNLIDDGLLQIAFIGRSNAGKSSLINTLVNNKKLARSSATAGRTQEINFFLINKSFYFVDLPGYGYARGSHKQKELITERIDGYFFKSHVPQYKVVLIIDANVGMTESDQSMLSDLLDHGKDVIVIANKIDKTTQSTKQKNINAIKKLAAHVPVVSFSSTKKIGLETLMDMIIPKV